MTPIPVCNHDLIRYIDFSDYSADELCKIFELNLKKYEYKIAERARNILLNHLQKAVSEKDDNFGNARFVRNLFEKTLERQANRLASETNLTNEKLSEISEEDMPLGIIADHLPIVVQNPQPANSSRFHNIAGKSVGDIHQNGKWIWTEYTPGKFDWRVIKGTSPVNESAGYTITLYKTNQDNTARFVLGNKSSKPLIVIGLNPSTADDSKPDPTIRKVMGFAERNGFDGFIMLNLYPQRVTDPKGLSIDLDQELMQENLKQIDAILNGITEPVLLASWGATITIRRYFKQCIKQIHELTKGKNVKWVKIGDLTQDGHPRHPLYTAYHTELSEFDINQYADAL